jgi:hypothetical protein
MSQAQKQEEQHIKHLQGLVNQNQMEISFEDDDDSIGNKNKKYYVN